MNKKDKLISKASNGQILHYSVGALIKKDGKYLLIDRVNPPFGLAGLAGHVDIGESLVQCPMACPEGTFLQCHAKIKQTVQCQNADLVLIGSPFNGPRQTSTARLTKLVVTP